MDITERFPLLVGDFRHRGAGLENTVARFSGVACGLVLDHAGIANARLAYMSWVAVLATALLRAPKVSTMGTRPGAPRTRT